MKDTGEMRNLEEKERIAESAGSSVPAGSEKKADTDAGEEVLIEESGDEAYGNQDEGRVERNAAETLQRETRIETTVWRQILGIAGENRAAAYLEKRGFTGNTQEYIGYDTDRHHSARAAERYPVFRRGEDAFQPAKGQTLGSGYSGENTSSASNGAALPVEIPAGMQRHPDRCGGNFVHRSQILYPLYGKYYRISDEEGGIHCIRS